jgi:betaine-aldehyde dehydrogenase/5-carboxymethyl-2-hydroxymuconic-semialdehyde dehydrogenase
MQRSVNFDLKEIHVAGVRVSTGHYINGARVYSRRTFTDISPIDGSVLGEISAGGQDEVNQAVAAAKAAFPAWAALGPKGRLPYLERLAHIIEARVPDLAAVETTDNGSLHEASRLRVMKRGAHNIHWFAEYAVNLKGDEFDTPHRQAHNKVLYQPSGVAALITPWNAPFMLSTWKVGPALASGCTVVLKPPEWAPLTCSLLADFAHEAGLPPGVFNVVQGIGEEAGDALVKHKDVARISFTGSPETARIIGRNAAANLTPVSFELGGKSPLIVFADADLDLALFNMLDQYDNAGQVCLAGTRLLVEETIADEMLRRMKDGAAKLVQGNPMNAETQVGPQIHPEHLQRVQGFVERAKKDGATLEYGGHIHPTLGGLYYTPTLFTNVREESELWQREVFGPVLIFDTFKDEAEAIRKANATDYGLAAIVFTRDEEKANRVAGQISAGLVWLNCFYVRDLAQPFGGNKNSGIGREGGIWSFDFYCDVKTVCHKWGTFV